MKQTIFVIFILLTTASVYADKNTVLRAEMESFQFLVGFCWSRPFGQPQTNVHCFEPVYGGLHLRQRTTRSANSTGDYVVQEERIYSWNLPTSKISYVFWNSAGDQGTGTVAASAGYIEFSERSFTDSYGNKVTTSFVWENITARGFDALTVTTNNNEKTETRVSYRRRALADFNLETE